MAEGNLNYLGDPRGGDTGVSGQLLNIAEHPLAFGKMLIQEIFSFDNFPNRSCSNSQRVVIIIFKKGNCIHSLIACRI